MVKAEKRIGFSESFCEEDGFVDSASEVIWARIITLACPFCLTMLEDEIKDQGKEEEVKALDITEIVLKAMGEA